MTTYTDPFGGSAPQPSDISYAALVLAAGTTQLAWPSTAQVGEEYLPRLLDLATVPAAAVLRLPDATQVSTGQDALITNRGANTLTLQTTTGVVVATIGAGISLYVYLTDNSTASGSWSTTTFGAGVSSVSAGALAGSGLQASGSLLELDLEVVTASVGFAVTSAYRTQTIVWTGGSDSLTLDAVASLDNGFFFSVRNQGTGVLTLAASGADLIDGASTVALQPQESCIVFAGAAAAYYTVGRGRNQSFGFTLLIKAVTGGTVTLTPTEASNVVQRYTGVLTSNCEVVFPSVVQVYYVSNQTTGAFTLTFKTAGVGTTVAVPQGQNAILFCDGTNVINNSTTVSGLTSLILNPGASSAPAISFVGDTSTGLYQPVSGSTSFTGVGNEVARFTGVASAVNYATVTNSTTGQTVKIGAAGSDANISFELTPKGTGSLGVGVAPTYKIDVLGGAGNGIRYAGPTAQVLMGEVGNIGAVGTLTNHSLQIISNSVERARLLNTGVFLVGRTTDGGLGAFQVQSGGGQVADFLGTGSSYVNVRAPAGSISGLRVAGNGLTPGVASFDVQQDSGGAVDLVNRSNTRLSLYTNSLERVQISAAGSVKVGGAPTSGWRANASALQLGGFLSAWTQSNGAANVGFGLYEGGTNTFNYLTTGDAPTMYSQLAGNHVWYRAVAGVTGGAVTLIESARIDEDGKLRVNGAPGVATATLMARVATNRNIGLYDSGSVATVQAFSDAAAGIQLRVAGNGLLLSGDNGGTSHVNIGTDGGIILTSATTGTALAIATSTAVSTLSLTNTNAGASGVVVSSYANSASPANGDDVFRHTIDGNDSVGSVIPYAEWLYEASSVSVGNTQTRVTLSVRQSGSTVTALGIDNGTVAFPSIGTTASAANAFLDSGSSPANRLLRSTSSLRYKTDIIELARGEAESVLGRMNPVTYRSKAEADDPGKRWYGFIAEELAAIEPKLVHFIKNDAGEDVPDGVQYERITVLLVAAVQEIIRKMNY